MAVACSFLAAAIDALSWRSARCVAASQNSHRDVSLLPRRLQILEMLVQLGDLIVVVNVPPEYCLSGYD